MLTPVTGRSAGPWARILNRSEIQVRRSCPLCVSPRLGGIAAPRDLSRRLLSALGHFRQIDTLPPLAACLQKDKRTLASVLRHGTAVQEHDADRCWQYRPGCAANSL